MGSSGPVFGTRGVGELTGLLRGTGRLKLSPLTPLPGGGNELGAGLSGSAGRVDGMELGFTGDLGSGLIPGGNPVGR